MKTIEARDWAIRTISSSGRSVVVPRGDLPQGNGSLSMWLLSEAAHLHTECFEKVVLDNYQRLSCKLELEWLGLWSTIVVQRD